LFYQFQSPWVLGLLIIPLVLAILPLLSRRYSRPATLRYADISFAAQAGQSWRVWAQPLLPVVRMLALALVIVALARPQQGQAHEIIKGEGVDIALALDISGSMASLDFEPENRLLTAKRVIDEFVSQRGYDRIGLVVFAANAFNQSPPTIDHRVLSRVLNEVNLASALGIPDGTAIGLGLANAANMLKESDVKSKVVILLTDGVNNAGEIDPLTAAEAAKTLGIKVYTIGMGKQGQVPFPSQDFFGREVIVYQESDLDEEILQQIAETTGGKFYRAEDTTQLQQVYDEINSLEKSEIEVQTFATYKELALWFLFPALVLLMFEMLLRQTVLRKIP